MQIVPQKEGHCLDRSNNHGTNGGHLQNGVFRLPLLKTLQHTLSFLPGSMSHQSYHQRALFCSALLRQSRNRQIKVLVTS